MSLADELLADLEDMNDDDMDMKPVPSELGKEDEDVKMEFIPFPTKPLLTLDDVSKLRNSDRLGRVLEEIEKYSGLSRTSEDIQVCFYFMLLALNGKKNQFNY